MDEVVPVRVAAERLGMDRRRLSRLLHAGDLPTAAWREQGRWVDVEAVRAALEARRNGDGRRHEHRARHGRGPDRGVLDVREVDGGGIDPAYRAMASALAREVVAAAVGELRAAGERRYADAERLLRDTAARLASADAERRELEAEREHLRAARRGLRTTTRRNNDGLGECRSAAVTVAGNAGTSYITRVGQHNE